MPYDMLMDVGEIDILDVVGFYDRYTFRNISPPKDQFAGFKTLDALIPSRRRRTKLPVLPTKEWTLAG